MALGKMRDLEDTKFCATARNMMAELIADHRRLVELLREQP